MYTNDPAGPGWQRYPDSSTADPNYGRPDPSHGRVEPWYERPTSPNPDVIALVEDTTAPHGRDEHGNPLNESGWNERYARPDHADGSPGGVRWPANDGAAPGTRVHYSGLDSLLRDYPEFERLDRIGRWTGDYLTVDGTPFEQRGLTPGHTGMELMSFDLTPPLPSGVSVEISVIDEALGYPGGGWQIRFFRTSPSGALKFLSVDELIDLEVLR